MTAIQAPSASARAAHPARFERSAVARASDPTPQALTPQQIRAAYSLPARGARGQRIAIISAGDDVAAQSDLNAYDSQWGLPACTAAHHCFEKLNQNGQPSPLPTPASGAFVDESATGIEIAHGLCESCSVLLVEANSSAKQDLSAAVAAAAKAGATVIVTTFAESESPEDSGYVQDFLQPKAVVVSAAGDGLYGGFGYGEAQFPSAIPYVIAAGGTDLKLSRSGGYGGEQAWSSTVSGCSMYFPAASWQQAVASAAGCGTKRAVADLSAMSEPGAAIHITGSGDSGGPWFDVSGTSLSAPILGGVIGLAGSLGSDELPTLYARAKSDPSAFHDVRLGANAGPCQAGRMCESGPGYDGPTGLGSPDGLAAFLRSGGALSRRAPGVTVSARGGRLRLNRRYAGAVTVVNTNPFAVTGTLVLRRTLRIGGHRRTVAFASTRLTLAPLEKLTRTLTISTRNRALLRSYRSLKVYVALTLRGPVGPTVSDDRQGLTVLAP